MKKITNPAYLNALKQCQLFANMDSRELAEAIEFLDGRVRKYDKEEAILLLGDALIKAGIVLEGTIESAFENENYDRISMRRFGSGYLFGEALVCNQISESPIQISAVNGATILFVGDDWYGTEKWQEYEKAFKEAGIRIVYFPYTHGISSTKITEALKAVRDKD